MKNIKSIALFAMCSMTTGFAMNQTEICLELNGPSDISRVWAEAAYSLDATTDSNVALNNFKHELIKSPSFISFMKSYEQGYEKSNSLDKVPNASADLTNECKDLGEKHGVHISKLTVNATPFKLHFVAFEIEEIKHKLIIASKAKLSQEDANLFITKLFNFLDAAQMLEQFVYEVAKTVDQTSEESITKAQAAVQKKAETAKQLEADLQKTIEKTTIVQFDFEPMA